MTADGKDGIEAALLGAVTDNDFARLVIEVIIALELLADGGAQFGGSGTGSVLGESGIQGLNRGSLDMLRCIKIGLAGTKTVDVNSLGTQGLGLAVDGEGERGGEFADAVCEIHGKSGFGGFGCCDDCCGNTGTRC